MFETARDTEGQTPTKLDAHLQRKCVNSAKNAWLLKEVSDVYSADFSMYWRT